MEHIFIINPTAGRDNAAPGLRHKIADTLGRLGIPYEIHMTQCHGDATTFVRRRCSTTQRQVRFYACGGDGTLNEVVNGAVGFRHADVTAIPCGSGNDFVRTFGPPEHFTDLERLVRAESRLIDLIRFSNGQYGVNMCNAGFDANVSRNQIRFKSWRGVSGPMAYNLSLAYCFAHRMTTPMRIVLDGHEVLEEEFLLCAVGNGAFCGGGFKALPRARVDDGMIDVCLVPKVSRATFLTLVGSYHAGTHLDHPRTAAHFYFRRCTKLEITSSVSFPAGIDGECFVTTGLAAEIVPQSIRFAAPRRSAT